MLPEALVSDPHSVCDRRPLTATPSRHHSAERRPAASGVIHGGAPQVRPGLAPTRVRRRASVCRSRVGVKGFEPSTSLSRNMGDIIAPLSLPSFRLLGPNEGARVHCVACHFCWAHGRSQGSPEDFATRIESENGALISEVFRPIENIPP